MKRFLITGMLLSSLAGLAACGVDGPPVRPDADVGVTISPQGVSTSASVGISAGIMRVRVGL